MKYSKLISRLTKKQSNNGYVAVALVAGLAAGALISMLFAPENGDDTRKFIKNKAKKLAKGAKEKYMSLKNYNVELEDEVAPEIPHFVKTVPKKRKSDIADIVHDAHEQQNEN